MFSFLKRWLGHEATAEPPAEIPRSSAGNRVPYHPNLIEDLKSEHQELVDLLGRVSKALDKGDIKPIPKLLHEFGVRLRAHLLKENVELYVYLTRNLAGDPDNQALIRDLKREMMQIGRSVNQFLETYVDHTWDQERKDKFAEDFAQLTEVLGQRIQVEESDLYTLYLPPDSYGETT